MNANIIHKEPMGSTGHTVLFSDLNSASADVVRTLSKYLPGRPSIKSDTTDQILIEFWSSDQKLISEALENIRLSFPEGTFNF